MLRREFISRGLSGLSLAALGVLGWGCARRPTTTADGGSRPDLTGPPVGDASVGPDAGRFPKAFRLEPHFATLLCSFPADLEGYGDNLLGVCTATQGGPDKDNMLFQIDPKAGRPIQPTVAVDPTDVPKRYLNQVAVLPNGRGAATANDGFYTFTVGGGYGFVPFPAQPADLNTGGGILFTNGKLFMTVAQLMNGAFGAGAVLVYDAPEGVVQEGSARVLKVTHPNPTGLALRRGREVVVLNSGTFDKKSLPSINIIDAVTEAAVGRPVLFPQGATAQISGDVALTDDGGTAIVGTADDTGRVFRVDLDNGKIVGEPLLLSGTFFHSSVRIQGGVCAVTDFSSGFIHFLRVADLSLIGGALLFAPKSAGPSAFLSDGSLVQAGPRRADLFVPEY